MKRRVKLKKKRKEASIRGLILREVIAHFYSEHLLEKRIRGGEARKKPLEPRWKCPAFLEWEEISMENFKMEYLSHKKGRRTDYVILQLHGGGYVGTLDNSYRIFAGLYNELSDGMDVLTLDYRVAPEDPFPAALEDALAAFDWLLKRGFLPHQIILAGDSAGGGLALGLCMYLKDDKRDLPGGLVLMSPWTDLTASGPSYDDNFVHDPLFGNTKDSLLYDSDYIGENDPKNPYISPMFGDYAGFPPMLIQVGSIEMLLSDSLTVAEKAKEAGAEVHLSIFEGMFHLFQKALKMLPESREAWGEIKHFLSCF